MRAAVLSVLGVLFVLLSATDNAPPESKEFKTYTQGVVRRRNPSPLR
jgi:hypothetical protein